MIALPRWMGQPWSHWALACVTLGSVFDQVTETYTALNRMGRGRHSDEAKHKRNYLMHYFRSEAGKVSWQERMIPRQEEDTSDEEI